MVLRTIIGLVIITPFAFSGLYADQEGTEPEDVKSAKKIIISKDKAIVNGDTINLDDLKEDLRRIGELDITIVGRLEDLEEEGISKKRNEVVKFGGDIRVEKNEKIVGSVVVFGGNACIAGSVTEDVVVLGGDLIIEETADIRGSAVCFGGDIEKMAGAKIGDQEVSLGSFPFGMAIHPFFVYGDEGVGRFMHRGIGLFTDIVLLGLLLLLGAGIIFFFPNALDRVEGAVDDNLLKSGFVGLLGEILVLPLFLIVTVVLCVSIIGIPLLFLVIPLGLLGLVAACCLGYIGVSMFAGQKFGASKAIKTTSRYRVMVVGIIILLAFNILATIVGLTGSLGLLEILFCTVGGLITYLAATIGFGAVIMTRFGTRSIAVAKGDISGTE
jgi:hypothetical protein